MSVQYTDYFVIDIVYPSDDIVYIIGNLLVTLYTNSKEFEINIMDLFWAQAGSKLNLAQIKSIHIYLVYSYEEE